MQVLVKGLRNLQLYPPNNPIYQKTVDNIRAAFAPVWEECAELDLRVHEGDIIWEETAVLSQPDKSDSLGWGLFKDGVRSLTLAPGIEDEEIVRLLDVIHKARALRGDATDDLLTLLWEQEFHNVRYTFVELGEEEGHAMDPSESGWQGGEAPTAQAVRGQVEEDVATPSGVVSIEDFDSTPYFLEDDEIEYLRGEIHREYQRDLRSTVLARLFDLFELQTEASVREELTSIIENFVPQLLGIGDFHSVAYLLSEIPVVLERAPELAAVHRQALAGIPVKLSEPEALDQLLQSLDEAAAHPTEEDLSALFGELRAEALERVLEWLPKLSNERVRSLLGQTAQRIAQANPDQLFRMLKTAGETVLLEAIQLSARLSLPTFVPALGDLLEREDPTVRRAVVSALAAAGSPQAMKHLEHAIGDSDRDVRIAAVRVLTKRGQRGALPAIEAAVRGGALRNADVTEKRAFFEAYGLMVGTPGIATLRAMLRGKGFMRRKGDPETRACAAMALSKIADPEARAALTAAAGDKDPLVKNAINRALRESK